MHHLPPFFGHEFYFSVGVIGAAVVAGADIADEGQVDACLLHSV